MIKNKKILTVLSTAAITGLLVAAVNSTAFAKAATIAVNSKDGKVYEYQYDALKSSAVAQLNNGSTDPDAKLYNDFLQRKTSVRAYYDDVRKSYVEFDTIAKEAVNSITKGTSFNLKSFMESTTTPTTSITTNPVSVDANGNLIINGQTITTTVDMTTVKCSNPVDSLSTLVSFKLSVSDPEDYTVTVKGKTASMDATTGNFTAYVAGKVSTSDIKVSDFTINKKDLSDKPVVKSVTAIDSETICVAFNKNVDYLYAHNPANYHLLDSNNIDISNHIKAVYNAAGETDADNGANAKNTNTFLIKLYKSNPINANDDWRLTNSNYTLTIKNIIDKSATPNTMDDYTCIFKGKDGAAPKVAGIYGNLGTSTDKDKVVVYFNETMNVDTLVNKNNYEFVNGQGDTKSLPTDATITVGGDDTSVIIEFPLSYHVLTNSDTTTGNSTDISKLVVSNVTNESGITLDGGAYISKINAPLAGTSVKDNTIRTYYDGDNLKVDVQFTRAIDQITASDFTFGGVTPTSASYNGNVVTLTFKGGVPATTTEIAAHPITYANGKTNSNPTKIDIIKSQCQAAKLAINSTGTTDETGAKVSTNADGSPVVLSNAQSTIYDYLLTDLRTAPNYWSATKDSTGGTVYITFDTPLDPNSAIKSDDFVFIGTNGTDIKADSVTIMGNTNTVVFKFNTTNKNYASFIGSLNVAAKKTVSLRTVQDADYNNNYYVPSNDDLMVRKVLITG
jgi:hypothetical protein